MTSQCDSQDTATGEEFSPYQTPARVIESDAAPPARRLQQTLNRLFRGHRLRVAAVWLLAAVVSRQHPGDEYGLFFVATGLLVLTSGWRLLRAAINHGNAKRQAGR